MELKLIKCYCVKYSLKFLYFFSNLCVWVSYLAHRCWLPPYWAYPGGPWQCSGRRPGLEVGPRWSRGSSRSRRTCSCWSTWTRASHVLSGSETNAETEYDFLTLVTTRISTIHPQGTPKGRGHDITLWSVTLLCIYVLYRPLRRCYTSTSWGRFDPEGRAPRKWAADSPQPWCEYRALTGSRAAAPLYFL